MRVIRHKKHFVTEKIKPTQDGRDQYRTVVNIKPTHFAHSGGSFKPIKSEVGDSEIFQGFGLSFDELLVGGFRRVSRPNRAILKVASTGRPISLAPLGGNEVTAQRFTQHVPMPYLTRPLTGIIYEDLWNGADLAFEYIGHGIHKYIILKDGHPTTFRFAFNRRRLRINRLGQVLIEEYQIPSPFMDKIRLSKEEENPVSGPVPLSWRIEEFNRPGDQPVAVLAVDLPPGDWAGYYLDPTFISQPDGTDGKDAEINQNNPTTNYGTITTMRCGTHSSDGHRHYFIKFPLSAIPAGSEIHNMLLNIVIVQKDNPTSPYPGYIHRSLKNWAENQITWNNRVTGVAWSAAGALAPNDDYFGADQADGRIGYYTYNGGGFSEEFIAITLGVAGGFFDSVQNLFDTGEGFHTFSTQGTPGTNRGHAIASSDHGTASYRPKLTVDYSPPAYGRLWAYSLNPLGEKVIVLDALGDEIPYEEMEADEWYEVSAPSLPTPVLADDLIQEKRFAFAEEIEFTNPDGISLSSSTSEFADVVVARAAGRAAL